MSTIKVTVNGSTYDAEPDSMLIATLRRAGVDIPTLCHDDRLTPYGGCRLCVVDRKDGRGGLIPACSTPVQAGMVVETETPAVAEARRRQLQLLVLDHRMECPVCERRGDCRLQDLVFTYWSPDQELPFAMTRRPQDTRSKIIVRDPEKCIACGKCARLCDEVQGVAEIGLLHRGLGTRIGTFLDRPLDCEFCGQCVNACPVGALTARPYTSNVPVWTRTRTTTTCSLCSCGCQVDVECADGSVVDVKGDTEMAPNHGKLCARAWLGGDLLTSEDRLTRPLVRRDGLLVETTMEEALRTVAAALVRCRETSGRLTGVAGTRLSCEDASLFGDFLNAFGADRRAVGPDGGVRAIHDGVGAVIASPGSTATIADLRRADLVVVLRADPTCSHPLVKTELVQRLRQDERPVVLACSFPADLGRLATWCVPVRPGRDEALLHGLAHLLGDVARERGGEADLEPWLTSLAPWTPAVVHEHTGVSVSDLTALAEQMRAAQHVVLVLPTALGLPGDEVAVARAAAALSAALGPGCGLLVLPEKANGQGVLDVGLEPLDPAQLSSGGVLYLVGQDPLQTWPRAWNAQQLLDGADFVVVQDAFLGRTGRRADVVLPATLLMERSGTVVGADGVPRRLVPAVAPAPGVLADGSWLRHVAHRAGVELPSETAVADRVVEVLERRRNRRAVQAFPPVAPPRPPQEILAPVLDSSPDLFMSGTVTGHSHHLRDISPASRLRLCASEAARLGVSDGHTVRLRACGSELLVVAKIDDRVAPGVVAVPWSASGDSPATCLLTHDGEVASVAIVRS